MHCQSGVQTIDGPLARIIKHRVSITNVDDYDESDNTIRLELDSHADSPAVGRGAHVLEYTGRKVTVSGFTDALGEPMSVDVVHAVITYDCPISGSSYPMLISNALLVPSVDCCLINPFMMRLAGVQVDECPKFLSPIPSVINHSIYFPEIDLRIPLMLEGIVSYLLCRRPHQNEYNDTESFLYVTPMTENWDPHVRMYSDQEMPMMDSNGDMKSFKNKKFIVSKILSRNSEPSIFAYDLVKSVECNPLSSHKVKSIKSVNGVDAGLDSGELAKV